MRAAYVAITAGAILLVACRVGPNYKRPQVAVPANFRAPTPLPPIRPTNPRLPVMGERVWTTGEGLRVVVRLAVHAVRRIEGATVLDWSITPISAPRLQSGEMLFT